MQESYSEKTRKAEAYFAAADKCLEEKKYQQAIARYDRGLKLASYNAQAWYNRGICKRELGQHEEAIKDYDEAIRIEPLNDAALFSRAYSKAEIGQHKEAIEDYKRYLRRNSRDPMAWNNLGVCRRELKLLKKSITCFDKAINIDPAHELAWRNRGESKAALGNHREAIKDFDEAIGLNFQDKAAWFSRAISKGELGQDEEAIKDYDEVIKLNPKYSMAFNNRGWKKEHLGQYESALADYTQAIELNERNIFPLVGRGFLYQRLGQKEKAQKDWQQAITLKVTSHTGYCQRGLAYFECGQWDKAVEDFTEALKLNDKTERAILAFLYRAKAKMELKGTTGAIEDCGVAKSLNAINASQYYYRGQACHFLGMADEALQNYEAALKLRPHFPELYLERARSHEMQGDNKSALADIQCALKQNPFYPEALELQKKLAPQMSVAERSNDYIVMQKSSDVMQIPSTNLRKEQKLKEGNSGIVFQGKWAKDNRTTQEVAIKQLRSLYPTPKEREEFFHEAGILAKLQCDYIVTFYGMAQEGNCLMLVMEFCAGGSLYDRLHSREIISRDQQLKWGAQIINGVAYLHDRNIIHGDLATRNVLLTKHGDAKLTDFGLSKTRQNPERLSITMTSEQLPYAWSAPEVASEALNSNGNLPQINNATDIYSLGVTLWEIVSRETPLASLKLPPSLDVKTKTNIIAGGYKDPIPENTPAPYPEVIESCRSFDPKNRPSAKGLQQQYGQLMMFGALPRASQNTTTTTSTSFNPNAGANNNLAAGRRMGQ